MIERAAKRRKVSDASAEGVNPSKKQTRDGDIRTAQVDERFEGFDDEEEEDDDDEDEVGEEEDETSVDGQEGVGGSESEGKNTKAPKAKSEDKRHDPHATNGNGATQRVARQLGAPIANSTSTTSQSSLFKLQVEEMLRQVAPNYGKKEAPAVDMLKKVKDHIERIADRAPQTVEQAERQLVKSHKIVVPFSKPKPASSVNYKLSYSKPANINVAGSYPLKTAIRIDGRLSMDLVVTMPSSIFSPKDYLNHRYFHKRAYYLACIAAGLKSAKDLKVKMSFSLLNGNYLTPVILIQSAEGSESEFARSKCDIRIIPAISDDVFLMSKTTPNKNCVRPQDLDATEPGEGLLPTPFYNATVRSDSSYTSYLKFLHSTGARCAGFHQACLLGRIWLRQRGFSSTVQGGGIGNFEWSATIALLLSGGGPTNKPLLSSTYDGQQLFRATLQLFATRDLSNKPLKISADAVDLDQDSTLPMIYDGSRGANIMYKMTSWSYQHLRQEAHATIRTLTQGGRDKFDPTFIVNVGQPLLKYDTLLRIPINDLIEPSKDHDAEYLLMQQAAAIQAVLKQGLGDRATLVSVMLPQPSVWAVDSAKPQSQTAQYLTLGVMTDSTNLARSVDRGPAAEEADDASAFRDFWGPKSELRRFKDGQILESVVWESKKSTSRLVEIVAYLLVIHIDLEAANNLVLVGNNLVKQFLNDDEEEARTAFDRMRSAYKTFEKDIRGLKDLPLEIRQIQPSSSDLRSTSVNAPSSGHASSTPADVVIQFEGSGRWPDDLTAIQMTKLAFLLMLEGLLAQLNNAIVTRPGLENEQHDIFNKAFLDVQYPSGAAFRIRIHHEREQTLIERRLTETTSSAKDKLDAAAALAHYKKIFIRAPLQTQALQAMTTRYPAFSSTVRLVKKWFNEHLLGNHFAEELIEAIVARTFLQPQPWQTPSTANTGLLRTLLFLSRWDWQHEPLIVNFSEGLKPEEIHSIRTRFEAWRKLDPALNRVVLFVATNLDMEGTTWTEHKPARVVAGRMTSLASAAVNAVQVGGLDLDLSTLFKSPLNDYDFVVHLAPRFTSKKVDRKPQFKNLQSSSAQDRDLVGYKPVELYFEELQTVYEDPITFFHDTNEGDIIAGLWNPNTVDRPWKVNLPYSTIPGQNGQHVDASINKPAILAEIARLGGDMVSNVTMNR